MAEKGVLWNGYLLFNSVDLSTRVRSLRVSQSIEGQDDTVMGDTGRSEAQGLHADTVEVELNQDFAASGAGSVDVTISERIGIGKTAPVIIRTDSGVVGATNPEWTGSPIVKSYEPIAGKVGDQAIARLTLFGPLTRETA